MHIVQEPKQGSLASSTNLGRTNKARPEGGRRNSKAIRRIGTGPVTGLRVDEKGTLWFKNESVCRKQEVYQDVPGPKNRLRVEGHEGGYRKICGTM
ncbi:hypothetical protein U9M48_033371 [Paspalum notatum var. saurae]|uniref:Uncharacterized protein n=1 Tax=Paspalum notatum var. saurae TaxID=547442 RepID=A0AAQ3U889_PASNO